ncbi:MAG: ATP-binding cassette domain-containing protein [Burkholderiaceae bacterium]
MKFLVPDTGTRQVLRSLWQALGQWRGRVALATALLVLSKLSAVGVPALLKAVVDRLTPAGPAALGAVALTVPVGLLVGYALLRYASTLFTELRDLVFARVGKKIVSGYAERVFGHLLDLSPKFQAQRHTGALVREVERGTDGLAYLLGAGLFTVLPTAVEFFAVLAIVMARYGTPYVAIIAGTLLGYAVWTARMTRARVDDQRRMNAHDSHAHGLLVDTLLNYEAVKVHGRESDERARYRDVLSQWVDSAVASQKTLSTLHMGQAGIIALGVGGVMLLAGVETAAGRLRVGDLVMVNAYLIQVFLPLNMLGMVFRETQDALLNTETLFALLRHEPGIRDAPQAPALGVGDTTVRFEQVDFGYDPQRPVIQGLSLEIPGGRTCAVVGSSGSGKSTLARLLLRLYDPDKGRVTIGGQPLSAVTQHSLRQAVGAVPQEPMLFNDTIAYNIGYGRPGASRDEIVAAARAAQADDFIRLLPEGYETKVGERGARLSGGEKQRVAIARAFLKNPPILVMDEATSALDSRAERAIQGALDEIARGRTTLIIAHRLSTIEGADEIVVMDHGRIAERGQHGPLLAQHGLYAQLWELQRQQQQAQALERRLAQHPVNLGGLLVLGLDSLRGELAARHTELFTSLDMGVATVVGDAARLARLVQLMCQLALQGAAGGRMEARIARELQTSCLTVGYHGRLDPAAAGAADTLELRTLAGEAGGRLSIVRDVDNQVQQYQIALPLPALATPAEPAAATAPVPAPAPPSSAPAQPLAGMRVMCVDDDEDSLDSLSALLQHDGARTECLDSGHAALDTLSARAVEDWPDVLVCDIALGPEDGHAVVRRIRALEVERGVPLGKRLPAVALTGMAQPEDRLRALAAGFQRHLAKPVAPDELARVLRQLARAHA